MERNFAMQSLCHHFQQRVAERGDEAAIRRADGGVALTWAEYGRQVRRIAAGLSALGVGRGDAVGLMLTNRPEFHVVDAAVMHLGGTGFSIYNTSAAPQIAYLLDNAQPASSSPSASFSPGCARRLRARPSNTSCASTRTAPTS